MKIKYFFILVLKMIPRFSKIMTAMEDKSRSAAFVPYIFTRFCCLTKIKTVKVILSRQGFYAYQK